MSQTPRPDRERTDQEIVDAMTPPTSVRLGLRAVVLLMFWAALLYSMQAVWLDMTVGSGEITTGLFLLMFVVYGVWSTWRWFKAFRQFRSRG